jgi:hypothetical protein
MGNAGQSCAVREEWWRGVNYASSVIVNDVGPIHQAGAYELTTASLGKLRQTRSRRGISKLYWQPVSRY